MLRANAALNSLPRQAVNLLNPSPQPGEGDLWAGGQKGDGSAGQGRSPARWAQRQGELNGSEGLCALRKHESSLVPGTNIQFRRSESVCLGLD